MGAYDAAMETTVRLLRAKGQAIVLVETTDGPPPDPEKPWKPGAPIQVEHPSVGVFLDFTAKEMGEDSRILQGDLKCLMPAKGLAVVPDTGMKVIRGVKSYAIVRYEELKPADDPIMYTLHCREG